jgi:hypothetical protein
MNCEFSLRHYEEILRALPAQEIGNVSQRRRIILNHDVDAFPPYALKMAEIEAACGISATYYILLHSGFYNALSPDNIEIFRKIASMGHEVGLHYDGRFDLDLSLVNKALHMWFGTSGSEISHHLNDIIKVPKIPQDLNLRTRLITEEGYGYVADSAGWWKSGCACTHLHDKMLLLIHPIWWAAGRDTLNNLRADINILTEKEKLVWDELVREHRVRHKRAGL